MLRNMDSRDAIEFDLNNGDIQISRNFKLSEYQSKDGWNIVKIHPALIVGMQMIRDHFKRPVTINSGYRTARHNEKVGGKPGSKHLYGMAADLVVKGVSPSDVASYAAKIGMGGIKAYATFTHVDVSEPRTW